MTSMPGMLPSSPDLEREVLGAVLVDPTVLVTLTEILSPSDFYLDRHRLVWEAYEEAQRRDVETIDEVVLKEIMTDLDSWGRCGGWDMLDRLLSRRGATSMAVEYASRLRSLSIRRGLFTVGENIGIVALEAALDAPEAIGEAERLVGGLRGKVGGGKGGDAKEVVASYMSEVRAVQEGKEKPKRISSGLYPLDKALGGGFKPGWLVLITSLNGHGKTALGVNGFAWACVSEQRPCLVVSLEMTSQQLIGRLIAAESGVPVQEHDKPGMGPDELSRMAWGADSVSMKPLRVVGHRYGTVEAIKAAARSFKSSSGDLGMVVVDYIQLVRTKAKMATRTEELEFISRGLKEMAMELECVVVSISQPVMSAKRLDKRPTIRDSKGSGAIDDDADLGLVPWLPHNVDPDALQTSAQIGMDKFRHGRRRDLTEVDVEWDGPCSRFVAINPHVTY